MPLVLFLSLLMLVQQSTVPYKPAGEFDIEVDLQLRSRNAPPAVGTEVPVYESKAPETQFDGAPHAYLSLNLKLKHLSDREVRCLVKDLGGNVTYNKKVKDGSIVKLEIGFVDDIKEKRKNAFYDVILADSDKTPISHIRVTIDSEGLYLVNGEKSGKF